MAPPEILILSGTEVGEVLRPALCLEVVEAAFRELARGLGQPGVLGLHVPEGSFHIKAAVLGGLPPLFAGKINANFPANPERRGLPTIQGVLALFDADTGVLLALMDSIRVTALRTAAATALAARYLARADASRLLVIGCGTQAPYQVRALRAVLPIARVELHDLRRAPAEALADSLRGDGVEATVVDDSRLAARRADVVVTCTSSRQPILGPEDVSPGSFVAAVGADNEHKHEIEPALMACALVVVDVLEQCAAIGDLRGAIQAGVMTKAQVHAALPELVSGLRQGREREDQVFVFDSTGTAVQDVAVAGAIYRSANRQNIGMRVTLAG
jgi:ornithine cyclodeaminase/alanine dehydrogenase-like protein (mu-crystallin family)